ALGRARSSPCFPYTTLFRSSTPPSHEKVVNTAKWSDGQVLPRTAASSPPHSPIVVSTDGAWRRESATCSAAPAKYMKSIRSCGRSEEHTSELQSRENLVWRL